MLERKYTFLLMLCAVVSVGCMAKDDSSNGEKISREQHMNAAESLLSMLPKKFLSHRAIEKLQSVVTRSDEGSITMQERILELQARAEELQRERGALVLAIDTLKQEIQEADTEGTKRTKRAMLETKEAQLVVVDNQLVRIEKELDDVLYDDGILNWKSLLALGAGAVVGVGVGHAKKGGLVERYLPNGGRFKVPAGKSHWFRGMITGLVVATAVEYCLRGRRALLLPNLIKAVKFVLKGLGKLGVFIFQDGGIVDHIEVWVESIFRPVIEFVEQYVGGLGTEIVIVGAALIAIGAIALKGRVARKA